MTRQDLVNKSIDKLNTVKEALELIEILEYAIEIMQVWEVDSAVNEDVRGM